MSILYLGLGMVVLGLAVVAAGLVTRNKARRILSTPLRRTGEAANAQLGPASFEGAVASQQPLAAPCSGLPCAYYHLLIEKKVKEKQGTTTTVSWKKVSEQHQGSTFWIDDGSGPVVVHAHDAIEADLAKTFSGPPPGGPGLGMLANMVGNMILGHEEILEYRATEKIIPINARLFALGALQGGQLVKPASGKLIASTRGRAALVGSKNKISVALFAFGGALAAGGVPVMILKPGEAPQCGAIQDAQSACTIATEVVTEPRLQPDGSTKPETFRRKILEWKVTKPAKYELSSHQLRGKGKSAPTIQVENAIGIPMNIDFGLDIGAGATSTKTKTMKLSPGSYKIYVFARQDGPSEQVIEISEAGGGGNKTAEK